eukprot:tig00021038_g17514.t1
MSAESPPRAAFSIRIVNADFYMAPPIARADPMRSPLTGAVVREVPVVRVFGSTPAGQKACLHLHRAFPYFFVPYPEDLGTDAVQVSTFLTALAAGIERAMELSRGANIAAIAGGAARAAADAAGGAGAEAAPQAGRRSRAHIFKVALVRGKPFYGYYPSERLFVKIYLYNPGLVSRAAALLQSGAVLGRAFQPHEAHIPFLLQLFVDLNLRVPPPPSSPPPLTFSNPLCRYGMALLNLSSFRFRTPLPERPHSQGEATGYTQRVVGAQRGAAACTRVWTASRTPPSAIWPSWAGAKRVSLCELELDASVEDVMNRSDLPTAAIGNPRLSNPSSLRAREARETKLNSVPLVSLTADPAGQAGLASQPEAPESQPRAPAPPTAAARALRARLHEVASQRKRPAPAGEGEEEEPEDPDAGFVWSNPFLEAAAAAASTPPGARSRRRRRPRPTRHRPGPRRPRAGAFAPEAPSLALRSRPRRLAPPRPARPARPAPPEPAPTDPDEDEWWAAAAAAAAALSQQTAARRSSEGPPQGGGGGGPFVDEAALARASQAEEEELGGILDWMRGGGDGAGAGGEARGPRAAAPGAGGTGSLIRAQEAPPDEAGEQEPAAGAVDGAIFSQREADEMRETARGEGPPPEAARRIPQYDGAGDEEDEEEGRGRGAMGARSGGPGPRDPAPPASGARRFCGGARGAGAGAGAGRAQALLRTPHRRRQRGPRGPTARARGGRRLVGRGRGPDAGAGPAPRTSAPSARPAGAAWGLPFRPRSASAGPAPAPAPPPHPPPPPARPRRLRPRPMRPPRCLPPPPACPGGGLRAGGAAPRAPRTAAPAFPPSPAISNLAPLVAPRAPPAPPAVPRFKSKADPRYQQVLPHPVPPRPIPALPHAPAAVAAEGAAAGRVGPHQLQRRRRRRRAGAASSAAAAAAGEEPEWPAPAPRARSRTRAREAEGGEAEEGGGGGGGSGGRAGPAASLGCLFEDPGSPPRRPEAERRGAPAAFEEAEAGSEAGRSGEIVPPTPLSPSSPVLVWSRPPSLGRPQAVSPAGAASPPRRRPPSPVSPASSSGSSVPPSVPEPPSPARVREEQAALARRAARAAAAAAAAAAAGPGPGRGSHGRGSHGRSPAPRRRPRRPPTPPRRTSRHRPAPPPPPQPPARRRRRRRGRGAWIRPGDCVLLTRLEGEEEDAGGSEEARVCSVFCIHPHPPSLDEPMQGSESGPAPARPPPPVARVVRLWRDFGPGLLGGRGQEEEEDEDWPEDWMEAPPLPPPPLLPPV